jgi:hypothetical protein
MTAWMAEKIWQLCRVGRSFAAPDYLGVSIFLGVIDNLLRPLFPALRITQVAGIDPLAHVDHAIHNIAGDLVAYPAGPHAVLASWQHCHRMCLLS